MAKLITKEILERLRKTPVSKETVNYDAEVILYIFNPYGEGHWLITSLREEREDGDLILYGYCELFGWEMAEWGPVSFNELKDIKLNIYGTMMPLERERYSKGKTVRQIVNGQGGKI